jgi:hypothetical protein
MLARRPGLQSRAPKQVKPTLGHVSEANRSHQIRNYVEVFVDVVLVLIYLQEKAGCLETESQGRASVDFSWEKAGRPSAVRTRK